MLFRRHSIAKKSYAKINLSLKVMGKREDGYHDLEMVNLPLELHDVIEIRILPEEANDTYITADDPRLNGIKHNLCHQAVDAMRKEFGFKENFLIEIHKEIPFAAGLGGGSSNAAVVMSAVNELLNLKATPEQLAKIGAPLGADIPYFFVNKPAKLTGIGEKIELIPVKQLYFCLLVKPKQGVSTKECYEICDNFPKANINTDKVIEGLAEGNDDLITANMGNDLQKPSISLTPEIQNVIEKLRLLGFSLVSMSGSGSCCFALTTDHKKAKDAYRQLESTDWKVRLCSTLK